MRSCENIARIADRDFYLCMVDVIQRSYQATASKSLRDVYELDDAFLNIEADAAFAICNRDKILAVLANPKKSNQVRRTRFSVRSVTLVRNVRCTRFSVPGTIRIGSSSSVLIQR